MNNNKEQLWESEREVENKDEREQLGQTGRKAKTVVFLLLANKAERHPIMEGKDGWLTVARRKMGQSPKDEAVGGQFTTDSMSDMFQFAFLPFQLPIGTTAV